MSDEKRRSIELSLIDTVGSDKLQELTTESIEVAFDALLNDGILKDIPVFSYLFSICKLGASIKDRIFFKKLWSFLFELNKIPISKRKTFIDTIGSNEKEKQRVGETLIVLLDQLDNIDKAKIIGKIFKYYLEEKIDYDMFLRLSYIVNHSILADFFKLVVYSQGHQIDPYIIHNLYLLGLLQLAGVDNEEDIFQIQRPIYEISELGTFFVNNYNDLFQN